MKYIKLQHQVVEARQIAEESKCISKYVVLIELREDC